MKKVFNLGFMSSQNSAYVVLFIVAPSVCVVWLGPRVCNLENPPHFKNRIMAQVYVRSITRSNMYQKGPFC